MPFPSNIAAEVSALNSAFAAAPTPITSAPQALIAALAAQADQLVNDVDTALAPAMSALDVFPAYVLPADMAAGVLTVLDAGTVQCQLGDLAGVAGRIASNLTNA